MHKIGFFHIAVRNHTATRFVVENVRLHHKKEPYILFSDSGEDFNYLARQYSITTVNDNIRTGPPIGKHGYKLPKILEFLSRFRHACELSQAEYIVMLEDDVLVLREITIPENCDFMGHSQGDRSGNKIHDTVLNYIQEFSKKYDICPVYACGGGSIFKTSIFLDNYEKIIEFYVNRTEHIQKYYPTWGWIDCFMHVYYLLAGATYMVNQNMIDTHNHRPGFDYNLFLQKLPGTVQIVNNFKKYYYE